MRGCCLCVDVLLFYVLLKIGFVDCAVQTFFDFDNNRIWYCTAQAATELINTECPTGDLCWDTTPDAQIEFTACAPSSSYNRAKSCTCKAGSRLVRTSATTANCFRICPGNQYIVRLISWYFVWCG